MKDEKGFMFVAEGNFVLLYRLFLPESEKIIDLIFLCSGSAGIFATRGGINDCIDLNSAIPKSKEDKQEKEKVVDHYKEEVGLTNEEIEEIQKLDSLYTKGRSDEFFAVAKKLFGQLYERMITPDRLKQNRLQECFKK